MRTLALALIMTFAFGALTSYAEGDKDAKKGPFPDFTLKNLDGKDVRLKDLLGKGPVLIDFWATWCKPCLKSIPNWEALGKAHKNLTVVLVNADDSKTVDKVKGLAKKERWESTILLDTDGTLQRKTGLANCPETYLLDKTGQIMLFHAGFRPGDEKDVDAQLSKMGDTQ